MKKKTLEFTLKAEDLNKMFSGIPLKCTDCKCGLLEQKLDCKLCKGSMLMCPKCFKVQWMSVSGDLISYLKDAIAESIMSEESSSLTKKDVAEIKKIASKAFPDLISKQSKKLKRL